MRIAVSIAGSDPTGGAGLQLDLQVFRALGVHGAGVVTALTVQDTVKVHRVLPAFPNVVLDQIRTLLRDVRPDVVKLGMLATDDVARAVALGLAETDAPLVIDPVLASSGGVPLLERRAWGALFDLFGRARIVTPNLLEAAQLTGGDTSTAGGVEQAARVCVAELGAEAALVKGGHREGPPDDCLAERSSDGVAITWLPGTRIEGPPVHGTGCALASAIAAGLARGLALGAAIDAARAFVAEALRRAEPAGRGARLLVLP